MGYACAAHAPLFSLSCIIQTNLLLRIFFYVVAFKYFMASLRHRLCRLHRRALFRRMKTLSKLWQRVTLTQNSSDAMCDERWKWWKRDGDDDEDGLRRRRRRWKRQKRQRRQCNTKAIRIYEDRHQRKAIFWRKVAYFKRPQFLISLPISRHEIPFFCQMVCVCLNAWLFDTRLYLALSVPVTVPVPVHVIKCINVIMIINNERTQVFFRLRAMVRKPSHRRRDHENATADESKLMKDKPCSTMQNIMG